MGTENNGVMNKAIFEGRIIEARDYGLDKETKHDDKIIRVELDLDSDKFKRFMFEHNVKVMFSEDYLWVERFLDSNPDVLEKYRAFVSKERSSMKKAMHQCKTCGEVMEAEDTDEHMEQTGHKDFKLEFVDGEKSRV